MYDQVTAKMLALIEEKDYESRMAWRLPVEIWLLENDFITVPKKAEVLPGSPEKSIS